MPERRTTVQSNTITRRQRMPGVDVVCSVVFICVLGMGVGCTKSALRPDDTRSQFDRYDQARNQRAQPFLEDEFGRRTPNLNERLLIRSE